MKKFALVPVFLLAGSLLVLLIMFIIRGITIRRNLAEVQATETSYAATLAVQQTTAAIPTDTPQPSATATFEPTATLPPLTDTPAATATSEAPPAGCNKAGFVTDVTIPDKKRFKPEKAFTKTWRIINNGSCTWDSSYTLYFVSGDRMSGPNSQQLVGFDVEPGKIVDISVDLVSPAFSGGFRGNWGFKDGAGYEFGVGSGEDPIYVDIVVIDP